ncbi:MAG: diaminopimelate decarboxylase [Bdellovibrionales bacterium]|nr:diaminopimelate decarboxylase [Bdellovibrionales bacterium]
MPLSYVDNQLFLLQDNNKYNLCELIKNKSEPFYLYDLEGMKNRVELFKNYFKRNIRVHYAMKANNHPRILKLMKEQGLGVDVVSGGELQEALNTGFHPRDIIFSGVGKTAAELQLAIEEQISQINVESPQELERIGQIAKSLSKEIRIAWRMNPDVKAETHPYITTGFRDNKFGMDKSFLPSLIKILSDFPQLKLVGLSIHIGSQIRQIEPFIDAIHRTKIEFENLLSEGFPLETLDIGGGLGINYEKEDLPGDENKIKIYAETIEQELADFHGQLLLEPGRVLVGSFGWLFGEVQYIKKTPWKNFAILNTGMHHLMRPSLYQAHHRIQAVRKSEGPLTVYEIVGPICESADVIGFDRPFSELKQGDWLVVEDVGAYGKVMASNYNSHQLPEEIFL